MTTQSFTAYLLEQVDRWDPVGDLARDVQEDSEWPKRGGTLTYFQTYLERRGAIPGAIDALYVAWVEYQKTLSDGGQNLSGVPGR